VARVFRAEGEFFQRKAVALPARTTIIEHATHHFHLCIVTLGPSKGISFNKGERDESKFSAGKGCPVRIRHKTNQDKEIRQQRPEQAKRGETI
jgi:hypothetical protein